MTLKLPVPDEAWSTQEITLGGINYEFTFSYNDRDSRWRFDLALNGTTIINGVKIVENQSLLERYDLVGFDHGDIGCTRAFNDGVDVGRDNLGIGKSYELLYFSNEEITTIRGG